MSTDITFCKADCPCKAQCGRGEIPKEAGIVSVAVFPFRVEGKQLSCEYFIPKVTRT